MGQLGGENRQISVEKDLLQINQTVYGNDKQYQSVCAIGKY